MATRIEVGGEYWTRVSGDRVKVRVIQDRGGRGRRFVVQRIDNGRILAQPRAASALHDGPGPW